MTAEWIKKIEINTDKVHQGLHGIISPAEVRLGEPIKLKIQNLDAIDQSSYNFRVWRMSPLGVEIVVDSKHENFFQVGHKLNIELSIGLTISKLTGTVLVAGYNENNFNLIGIRYFTQQYEKWEGSERRTSPRWACSKQFLPTGVAPNPAEFNNFIFFKVLNFSKDGMLISTSLRNKFLFPGMKLDCSISLPLVGHIKCIFEIKNTYLESEDTKDVLALGGKIITPSRHTTEGIAQYVFQFGPPVSLAELKANHLKPKNASTSIDFRFVRTDEEYKEVLELRKTAYKAANKLAKEEDVSDIYDTRSRIIIGLYKGKIVASTRLIFNEINDQMEHEQFVNLQNHNNIPSKEEICEITRVCTHPEFRGSDLLMSLLRFVGITVAQSGRRYILGCATDDLLPLYLKIGFKSTGIRYSHSSLNNKEHTVFIVDVYTGLTGDGVNPLVWNIVWADVAQYLVDRSVLQINKIANIRMGLYKLLRPISLFMYNLKRK